MAEQLVATHMKLVAAEGVLLEKSSLFLGSELDLDALEVGHGVAKINILEAFALTDVVVIGDVDTERAAIGGKGHNLKGSEIGSQEGVLLHLLGPREQRDDLLGSSHEVTELLGLVLINNGDPPLEVSAGVLGINICLDPAHIGLDDGSLILDPLALAVLVGFDVSSLIMVDVELNHFLLGIIASILNGFLQVGVHLLEVLGELSEHDVEFVALEVDVLLGALLRDAANGQHELVALLKNAGVQDIDLLAVQELLHESQVLLGHVAGEVAGDAALAGEVQASEGLLHVEDFLLDLRVQLVKHLLVESVAIGVQGVRLQDLEESLLVELGDELLVAEVVVVAHVGVESGDVGHELVPLLGGSSGLGGGLLQLEEVLFLEVGLEKEEEGRGLVTELMEDHLGSRPGGHGHEVGVVLLLGGEEFPSLRELEVLNAAFD
mmetsp:Transcript_33012/g.50565  ORF Transcript_33012/g.50565 Transcript_33012/m.50565 type:complete len:435 (-) Transcript_33012:16-1320(-)